MSAIAKKTPSSTTPKPVIKGGQGKPDLYDAWDLHIVGLDDEAGEEAALYDPRVKDAIPVTFIDSVAADGIMEPVEVVGPKDFRVVFGRKRTCAARICGLPVSDGGRDKKILVPVIFTPAGTTTAELGGRVLGENAQRVDDNALVTADKAAMFLKREGDTPANRAIVCRNLGIAASKLNKLLKLRSADPSVTEAIKDGDLSVTQAFRIATLPQAKQKTVTTKVVELTRAEKAKAKAEAKKRAEAKAERAAKRAAAAQPQEDEQVEDIAPARGRAARDRSISNRVVEREIDLALGGEGFIAPTTRELRELLETLRENPFLTDGVTADQILTYVVGDGPNPFDVACLDGDLPAAEDVEGEEEAA